MSNEINLGNLPIYVSEDAYLEFMNQKKSGDGRSGRAVFKYDYQRFAWAFVLGINEGKRKKIDGKKYSPFKWQVIPEDMKSMIIALTLQEVYKAKPEKLKTDLNSMSEESFNTSLRTAIEEYANEGFTILQHKELDDPGYIEDFEAVVTDILEDFINQKN